MTKTKVLTLLFFIEMYKGNVFVNINIRFDNIFDIRSTNNPLH